jgi:two-component system response regulator RegA
MQTNRSDRPSLLLVDDDPVFCQVLSRALGDRGFAVETAHDGATALRRIDAAPPEFAVIDLRLPDMSGLKLVEKLREVDPNTNIVVLTGYGSIATAVDAIKRGATYYLSKPTNADHVVAAFARRSANVDVAPAERPLSVDRLEWEHIQRVLNELDGNISAAARELNMHRRTLQRKLTKHAPEA